MDTQYEWSDQPQYPNQLIEGGAEEVRFAGQHTYAFDMLKDTDRSRYDELYSTALGSYSRMVIDYESEKELKGTVYFFVRVRYFQFKKILNPKRNEQHEQAGN